MLIINYLKFSYSKKQQPLFENLRCELRAGRYDVPHAHKRD